MIRLLIILALIVYVLSKLSGIFFRAGAPSQRNKNFQQRRPEGSVHVDSAPKKEKGGIKGGDYVDYEEVKWFIFNQDYLLLKIFKIFDI